MHTGTKRNKRPRLETFVLLTFLVSLHLLVVKVAHILTTGQNISINRSDILQPKFRKHITVKTIWVSCLIVNWKRAFQNRAVKLKNKTNRSREKSRLHWLLSILTADTFWFNEFYILLLKELHYESCSFLCWISRVHEEFCAFIWQTDSHSTNKAMHTSLFSRKPTFVSDFRLF